jgi:hypothetical protein
MCKSLQHKEHSPQRRPGSNAVGLPASFGVRLILLRLRIEQKQPLFERGPVFKGQSHKTGLGVHLSRGSRVKVTEFEAQFFRHYRLITDEAGDIPPASWSQVRSG